jgi:hypothetical protein
LHRSPRSSKNATTLASSDYEFDVAAGLVWRLLSDRRAEWPYGKVTVGYTAGYVLPASVPSSLEKGCLILVRTYYHDSKRDPAVRQVNIPGVMERSYWVGSPTDPALPKDVTDLLDPFCERLL